VSSVDVWDTGVHEIENGFSWVATAFLLECVGRRVRRDSINVVWDHLRDVRGVVDVRGFVDGFLVVDTRSWRWGG
jgi:hypothetical protein